jgi:uncharacterized small protein (DUF1192 family)
MSFDLHLAPASGFLDWKDDQWDEFFDRDPESFELGNARYVGLVLDAIARNLEGGQLGSKFPLLARIDTEERVGWYNDEISRLGAEIESIRDGLAALPVTRSTLGVEGDDEMQTLVRGVQDRDTTSPPTSAYDLFRYFFDSFQEAVSRASATGQGLYATY